MTKSIENYARRRKQFEDELNQVFDFEQAESIKALIDTHPDAISPLLMAIAKLRGDAVRKADAIENSYPGRLQREDARDKIRRRAAVLRLQELWEACQRARV